MKYENRVVRVQNLFFHTLPDRIERWQEEGYRIINTHQSKTFSGEEEIVIFLEREGEEKIKTNYDRIKSMSVEEMAQELSEIESIGCRNSESSSVDEWKQWLLQEVSDE